MRGRSLLTHGEVVAALVATVCAVRPLYDVSSWASSAAVAELLGVPAGLLNDDRLARALEALAPGRGPEAALAPHVERCKVDASRLHLDLTAVRFAGATRLGAGEEGPGRRTLDRPAGKDAPGLHPSGVSLYFRPHQAPKRAAAFMEAIESFAASLPPGSSSWRLRARLLREPLCRRLSKVAFVVPLRAGTAGERFSAECRRAEGVEAPGVLFTARTAAPGGARTTWRGCCAPIP